MSKSLQQILGIALVAAILMGCNLMAALPTPTATPLRKLTPTQIAATRTPTILSTRTAPPLVSRTPLPTRPTTTPIPMGTPVPCPPMPVPPMPTLQSDGTYPMVQLTTKLGTEVTTEVRRIDTSKDLLNAPNKLLLKTTDGVYLLIPLTLFRRAYESQGVHMVTLADNQELGGRLLGILEGSDQKKYDLGTTCTIVLTQLPKASPTPRFTPTKPVTQWKIQVTEPAGLAQAVSNPRFAFRYYSTAGYAIGGTNRTTTSNSFYLKRGTEEILANLADFEQISFSRPTPGGPGVPIVVKTKDGIETQGTLVLKAKDSAGEHVSNDWHLEADLANSEITMVLKNPTCLLRKETE